jgi:Protein of unknown function (DUF3558)
MPAQAGGSSHPAPATRDPLVAANPALTGTLWDTPMIMLRRLTMTSAMGLALVVAAACSSGSSPSSESSSAPSEQAGTGFTADALCALVTQAEVSAALGASVGPGVPSGVNAPSCSWQADDGSGATIAASDPGSVGQIPYGLQGIAGAHVTAVDSLGDKAYFAAGGTGTTAELDISKGGRAITITVGLADPNSTQAQQEGAEQAIGTAAATNM